MATHMWLMPLIKHYMCESVNTIGTIVLPKFLVKGLPVLLTKISKWPVSKRAKQPCGVQIKLGLTKPVLQKVAYLDSFD